MRKILNASECLTVKRNEQLRRKLKEIILKAIVELELILYPISIESVWTLRESVLKTYELKKIKEVEPLGEYFDTLFSKLSTNDEVRLNYFTEPATMKLLEIRKVVPKR